MPLAWPPVTCPASCRTLHIPSLVTLHVAHRCFAVADPQRINWSLCHRMWGEDSVPELSEWKGRLRPNPPPRASRTCNCHVCPVSHSRREVFKKIREKLSRWFFCFLFLKLMNISGSLGKKEISWNDFLRRTKKRTLKLTPLPFTSCT